MAGSRRLSQRVSKPLGINERNPYGALFADLPLDSVTPRGPWSTTVLDFGRTSIPSATAFATLGWTVTAAGVAAATLVSNSGNGYLLINPGTTQDTGYSLQNNVADVVPPNTMQFLSPNTTIAAGRDIMWGARIGLQNLSTTTWDSKWFMGLAVTDVALMTAATGALDGIANCVGFHCGEGGVIRLITQVGSTPTSDVLDMTPLTLGAGALSTTVAAKDFHDFFFYAHWNAVAGTTGTDYVYAFVDGNFVGGIMGNTVLPALTGSFYNTFEVLNGPAQDCDMAVGFVVNGTKRLYQTQI